MLIALVTQLVAAGLIDRKDPKLKRAFSTLDLLLLHEDAAKAKLLTRHQLRMLLACRDPLMAIPLALMLPSGARFADVARLTPDQCTLVDNVLHLRVRQQKNIRKRLHQRWLSLAIPTSLLPFLKERIEARPQYLVALTYDQFLSRLKTLVSDRAVSTYSIRRTVFEQLRLRLRTIEEIQAVTLHHNKEQLRWYLDAPTLAETESHTVATSWHADFVL